MKMVFFDCEYTSLHAYATLISVGMVTLEGNELYVVLNDYDKSQLTAWVRDNVLDKIAGQEGVTKKQACEQISAFLENYADGETVSLVAAGKAMDMILLFQLWHTQYPHRKQFHFSECLPYYLNHRAHFDLDTLFYAAGLDPNLEREEFVGEPEYNQKHDALYDAIVIRRCYLKVMESGKLPHIDNGYIVE